MPSIPRERSLDSTAALYADPYGFIAERAREHGSDVFQARILLQPTLCMTGPEAARLFYDESRFTRVGAAPLRLQKTLFGRGGVQAMDGAAHRQRKQMFLQVVSAERVAVLRETYATIFRTEAQRWTQRDRIVFYDEVRQILTRAVCQWADVPLKEDEVEARTRQLTSLYSGAGSMGPYHWRARKDRKELEAHLSQLIEEVRNGTHRASTGSALAIIANHRDVDGRLLEPRIAAVELLNVLRPTVAVSVYLAFVAHALHLHPDARAKLGRRDHATRFVQEVRRLYPFFPSVAAKTRTAFQWKGYSFPADRRVILDLHGTNRDPRVWDDPLKFDPERHRGRAAPPFGLIPQGGGDVRTGHRCPGEEIAIALMEKTLHILDQELHYEVPKQDLTIDETMLPALPKDGFVMARVRLTRQAAAMIPH